MAYQLPKAGQPADFIESAAVWSDIFRLLNEWKAGRLNPVAEQRSRAAGVNVSNASGNDREAGEVLQIDSMEQPDEAIVDAFMSAPVVDAIDPVWHTDIDNLVVVSGGVLDDSIFTWKPRHWTVVKVTVEEATDRFVMLDPDNLNQMKTADAGIWRIIGLDEENELAVVDLNSSQPFWRYELTETSQAPETTEAKLIRVDGTEFTDEINLSDPLSLMDDQSSGDKGWCIHIGNEFHAIQGPC
jgi:hypothetical protein